MLAPTATLLIICICAFSTSLVTLEKLMELHGFRSLNPSTSFANSPNLRNARFIRSSVGSAGLQDSWRSCRNREIHLCTVWFAMDAAEGSTER